jgi:hypothetical protein
MTTGERVGEKYLFLSLRQTGEIRGKKLSSTRQCLAKKRRKVRTEMQGGMTGVWEGHLLQVQPCNETNRMAIFSSCKA